MKDTIKFLNSSFGVAVAALLLYFSWWLFVVHFLYWKEYSEDSGNAAGTAALFMDYVTIALLVMYEIGFLIAAIQATSKRPFYLVISFVLLLPMVGIWLFETYGRK
ncbi:hypothetical protein [Hymenobacter yonginensis]|uniref:DUF2834 domain-containing protein n=1 Tax=Hymenobacter yonginensis TaxID=748197 RepID=A0ABY7PU54_9BACT|nr:hypothetical protein [Hymenobacter yonginensis]WBO86432.1 hypothetical protein O9Z63_09245 [Hymenobacter yonginensis]